MKQTCPKCAGQMILDFTSNVVRCKQCGYVRPDEIGQMYIDGGAVNRRKPRPHVALTFAGELSPGVLAAFETGLDLFYAGDRPGALKSFLRAADFQPEFVDAHLWAAKSTEDPAIKRQQLEYTLAYDPAHGEAMQMMMVLQGRLTPEQAARADDGADPIVKTAARPVNTTTTELNCPQCAGRLAVVGERVVCYFCGYTALRQKAGGAGAELLAMAMMERKAKAVRWNVGQRLVVCKQCGAEHTLTASELSNHCRFCGSTAVILSDALQSFEQPDGLLPFSIDIHAAEGLIQSRLNGLGQRIANLFNTNRVATRQIEAAYIPFWVFDAIVVVKHTRTVLQGGLPQTDHYTDKDMLHGVSVPGVKSPPTSVLRHILPFDLSGLMVYEPRWLAKVPAQLYTVDFERASLDARQIIAETMRRKHDKDSELAYVDEDGNKHAEYSRTYSRIESMIFQLLLLPVWIATLTEIDGDVRLALVNGQTGRVAFGKTGRKK